MKSKLIKIIGLAMFSIVTCYTVKNWNLFNSATSIEPKHINLSQHKLDISEIKTSNKPIWHIKTENPTISYNIVFKNEGKRSFPDKGGIITILDNVLMDGAGEYDSFKLKQLFIDNNIRVSIDFTLDNAIVSVYTVADNFELSVDLLTTILTKAHLDPKKIDIAKQKLIMELEQNKFSAMFAACEKLSQIMFEEGHPYRIENDKALKIAQTYTKKDCDDYYSKLFTAKNAMIVFAGPIEHNIVEKQFTRLLKKLSSVKHNEFKEVEQKTMFNNYGKRVHVNIESSQSTVCFALPFISKTSQKRFACRIANNILGGTATVFANRLFKEVRDKHGLTYGLYTRCSESDLVAALYGKGDTRAENVEKLIEKTKGVFKELAEKGITQEELDYHKTSIFSKNVFESTESIVKFVASCRMDNIESKYVNNYLSNYDNLTLEEVNGVIKEYFDCDKLIFVSAGKQA